MLYAVLIGIALLERLVFDLGPNIELVTMASIMVGMYGRGKWRWLTPLMIMGLSDVVLGWGLISIFTWSGFLVMVYVPKFLAWLKSVYWRGLGSGWLGVCLFYLWTNGGVWLTDQWGMYSRDLNGLILCYVNGLPFLKLQLLSVLLTVPLAILIYETVKESAESIWGRNLSVRA